MVKMEISNLSKSFDRKVLKNINIKLEPGLYGLLGANGAGKSTLMKILAGLLKATSGKATFNGKIIDRKNTDYLDNMAYLPQDFGVYSGFSGKEFIDFIGVLKGVPEEELSKRSEFLFDKFELTDDKNKNVDKYSGGMKRRIGLIQAFINNPKVILLDEPTAGLDPMQRLIFKNYLSEQSKDKIIIYSTHITEDIESICNKVVLIKNGEIVSCGSEAEVLKILESKVYEADIANNDFLDFNKNNLVINYRENNRHYKVRFISERQIKDAKHVKPNLEDLHLYYNKKNRGGIDV